jgi:hypothetical protein
MADNTYTGFSFEATLDQAIAQLGPFKWSYSGSILTTYGWQNQIQVSMPNSDPVLIVAGYCCERSCEATESALAHALHFITRHLGYEISDLDFTMWNILRTRSMLP